MAFSPCSLKHRPCLSSPDEPCRYLLKVLWMRNDSVFRVFQKPFYTRG